jgi:hypothetical protein
VGGRKEGRKKAVRAQREVNLAGGPTIEQTWQKNAASSHRYWGGCLLSLRKQRRGFHDLLKVRPSFQFILLGWKNLWICGIYPWNERMRVWMCGWRGVCVCVCVCASVHAWVCMCGHVHVPSCSPYHTAEVSNGRTGKRNKSVCAAHVVLIYLVERKGMNKWWVIWNCSECCSVPQFTVLWLHRKYVEWKVTT